MKTRGLYTGQCVGGPMHGRAGMSRYPAGFLLVDRPKRRVWIYDFEPDIPGPAGPAFLCRRNAGDVEDVARRHRAAEEFAFDVRAMP